ncbi:MAG TPA: Gp49 family protein [Steroidobacteraceae bacterium]|nr:Gp49 family protein [Steroidobacteraceae bacterium]
MTDKNESVEQELQRNGLTAPRVTPADIDAAIADEQYFTAADGRFGRWGERSAEGSPLSLLTFCVLVLRNGFTVTGESAVVSPENFDADICREIARVDALNKVWPLLGFNLKQKLFEVAGE